MTVEYPAGFDQTKLFKKPICGILAVAIAANVSYPVAYAACKRNLPTHAKRFGGKTWKEQRDKALSQLGIAHKTMYEPHRLSVMLFCARYAEPGKTYILEVRGHVMTFKDGYIIDQVRVVPWQSYSHPRIKLQRVIEITGSAWPQRSEG